MSGFGAFGQSSAFGMNNNSSSAFGGGSGLFGASNPSSNPFGQQGGGGSGFGQSSNSLFGGGGGFGQQQSTSGFGGGGFGASSSAFGNAGFGSSAFGSQSAFGNNAPFGASSSAFGSSSMFGSGARPPSGGFGSSGFGQSQNTWGASSSAFGSSSVFGANSSGSGLFGGASSGGSLFGNGNTNNTTTGFGSNPQQQQQPNQPTGTQGVQWQLTMEYDGGNFSTPSKYHAISMMSQFKTKSLEELRVEDYILQKQGGNNPNNQNMAGGNIFGGNTNTGFGASSSGFGNTSAFGQQANTGFGAPSNAGFGSSNPFGQSSSNAFGGGGGFGAQSGGSLFGQSSSSGFGSGGTNLFGASSGGGFGAPQSQAGIFGQSSGSNMFGGAQTGFGAQNTGSLFGSNPQSAAGAFGFNSAPSNNPFGGGASTGQSLFGANPASKPLFGAGQSGGGFSFASSQNQSGGSIFGNIGGAPQQTAPSMGFGFSGAGGIGMNQQPIQNQQQFPAQAPQSGGPTQVIGFGQTREPTYQETVNAVMAGGNVVAPIGASYGTVLSHLQRMEKELEKHNKLMEEQLNNKNLTQEKPKSLQIMVRQPPRIPLASGANQNTIGGSLTEWNASKTKPRYAIGRMTGSTTPRVTGTPVRPPPTPSAEKPEEKPQESALVVSRRIPFFSPQNFAGPKRTPRKASELEVPIRSSPLILASTGGNRRDSNESMATAAGRTPIRSGGRDIGTPGRTPGRRRSNGENATFGSASDQFVYQDDFRGKNNIKERENGLATSSASKSNRLVDKSPVLSNSRRSSLASADGRRRSVGSADMLWSHSRPSSWSLNRHPDSEDQYNPEKYLPYQSKEGFYTIPSMSELAALTMMELQRVEGFTVGRKGYGEITWLDPVDVRGLDLDMVVDIQRGEVAVYPEREADQLNAPARVTLKGMFKKKQSGTPLSDQERIAKYKSSLETFCQRNGLRFINYDGKNGSWVFEAPNFADDS